MTLAEALSKDASIAGQAFNFSNELQITVTELVNRILASMGSDLEPRILNEVSNEICLQYLDANKARTILDWTPHFTLEEGLSRTISWYKEFLGNGQR